jgi:hypothetical protein
MIANLQKSKIVEKLLKKFYKNGQVPSYSDLVATIQKDFRDKKFGLPFFFPRGATRGAIVDPAILKENIVEIKQDVDIAFQDISNLILEETIDSNGLYGEYLKLRQRLVNLGESLDAFLLSETGGNNRVLFDNFRNTDKIDLSNTTAYIDVSNGFATLPISTASSVRYPASSIQLVSENFTSGGYSIGSTFTNVFNDYTDQSWQAKLPNNGVYTAVVNLTGGAIIAGTANEVEINRIAIDPISTITIQIEGSTDKLNWVTLGNATISTSYVFELDPTWVLFLRFTISGETASIRSIALSMVGTTDTATLVSKALTSNTPIYNFQFITNQILPYGTSISHFMSTNNYTGWIPIQPGPVTLNNAAMNSIVFGNAGDFVADNLSSPTTLWAYSLNSGLPIIAESGQVWRGIGQFRVDSFKFNWDSYADTNHVPDLSDWDKNLGTVHSCYMQSMGVNSGDIPPAATKSGTSFLFNYVQTGQVWWGINLSDYITGKVLSTNSNYKITSYLYSDRDTVISNFGGGVYARNPSNPNAVPSVTNLNTWGWAMYVNSVKVAFDNTFYGTAVPGSGALLSSQGKSFPVAIKAGWNKIELLVYIPSTSGIDTGLASFNTFLLFRPNLFNFQLSSTDQYSFAPTIAEYPIWADGSPMKRVSEFFLKWNVAPWDNSYWAWRLDAASGTPSSVLLNYNPAASGTVTIDGIFSGSLPTFNLKYTFTSQPITTIYYKAYFSRQPYAGQPPKLNSYQFQITP